jgi:hypothetical protein
MEPAEPRARREAVVYPNGAPRAWGRLQRRLHESGARDGPWGGQITDFRPAANPCPTATVQDFLERYEVGDTVGVGGERRRRAGRGGGAAAAAPPRGRVRARGGRAWRRGARRPRPRRPHLRAAPRRAGFAVVKRGRDKTTGENVAIKVRGGGGRVKSRGGVRCRRGGGGGAAATGACPMRQRRAGPGGGRRRGRWLAASADACQPRASRPPLPSAPPLKVVDKSRYAAGDNSLEREIQVLCKVRRAAAAASRRHGGTESCVRRQKREGRRDGGCRTAPPVRAPTHSPYPPSTPGGPPQLHQAVRGVHHAAQGLHRHRARHRRRAARQVGRPWRGAARRGAARAAGQLSRSGGAAAAPSRRGRGAPPH